MSRPVDTSNPLRGKPADEARYGNLETYEVPSAAALLPALCGSIRTQLHVPALRADECAHG